MTDLLELQLHAASDRLRAACARSVLLVHHNDCDGLTAGALLAIALAAQGYGVECLAVEKIFPEVLSAICRRQAPVTIFVDLAGQNAGAIAELASRRSCTLILDHHRPDPISAPHVFLVNPELAGVSGDLEGSASALAYQFVRRLLPEMIQYADLGVLGALGDRQTVEGDLQGLNARALVDAEASGSVRRAKEGVQCATFSRFDDRPGAALARDLTRLGSVGYYLNGPTMALVACREGLNDRVRAALQSLAALETERFAKMEAHLQRGELRRLGRIQWFDVGGRFAPMGVKCVGTFCERVAEAGWADPHAYVVGMQPLPGEIPGLGSFPWNLRKVSVRLPAGLARAVWAGRSPDLMQLVPEACQVVGGFADGCHRVTAAAIIPGEGTERFILEMARALEEMEREEAT